MKHSRICPVLKPWLAEQVEAYKQEHDVYKGYAAALEEVLRQGCKFLGVLGITQARAKAIPSFTEKAIRKIEKYETPVRHLTDLCGARVVTYTHGDVARVCKFIRDNFRVDEANSLDIRTRMKPEEFGYAAVHYVVQLKRESPFVSDALGKLSADEQQQKKKRPPGFDYFEEVGERRAEIQVCTFLQHAWAAISHDRVYKAEFDVPDVLKRHLARVAALLEDSDEEFSQAVAQLDEYRSYYRAYMKPKEIREEIEKWEMVQQHDAENASLAHRIARLAMAVEDDAKAVEALEPFSAEDNAAILRDLGRSKCKLARAGRPELKRASELNPRDADTWRYLGDSYASENQQEAMRCYEEAYRAAPSSPHVLASYLYCRIQPARDVDFLPLMYPALEGAVQECRKLAAIGAHLPAAFFHAGIFQLLLNRPYDSLAAFARAAALSETASDIRHALEAVTGLTQPILNSVPRMPELQPLEWAVEAVRRFLRLAIVCTCLQRAERAAAEAKWKASRAVSLSEKLRELETSDEPDALELARVQAAAREAEEKAEEAKEAAKQAKQEADEAREEFRGPASADLKDLARPVAMVVGGCASSVQAVMETYREDLQAAFEGFEGTVFGGGTHEGVSGIVGDAIVASEGAIQGIGYRPHALPPDATPYEKAYKLHEASAMAGRAHPHTLAFTALEPIQAWIDLIASGVAPSEVRVLAINGGDISGFEVRMALALGARVAVIESSGRAATDLHADAVWWKPPHLIWLPRDPMSLRAFVNPGSRRMPDEDLKKAGEAVHQCYLDENRHKITDPAMRPWPKLSDEYRESNRQQAAYAEQTLRQVGYRVGKITDDYEAPSFTEEEVKKMAEMEHGRWIVERLSEGWRYGPERNDERKTSPHLVPWRKLPEEIRDYDRDAVRKFPTVLAKADLGIYPL